MKTITSLLFLAALLAASSVQATGKQPVLADIPPPGLHDPGVMSQPAVNAQADEAAPASSAEVDPLSPLPKPDSRLVRDKASRDASANAQRIAASEITTRQQGTDTVEEYRQKGHVWMIRIVPQDGPAQTFMANDISGRLLRNPDMGPVSPVYYTLYEWQ